jgi:hypothetical protein
MYVLGGILIQLMGTVKTPKDTSVDPSPEISGIIASRFGPIFEKNCKKSVEFTEKYFLGN